MTHENLSAIFHATIIRNPVLTPAALPLAYFLIFGAPSQNRTEDKRLQNSRYTT